MRNSKMDPCDLQSAQYPGRRTPAMASPASNNEGAAGLSAEGGVRLPHRTMLSEAHTEAGKRSNAAMNLLE